MNKLIEKEYIQGILAAAAVAAVYIVWSFSGTAMSGYAVNAVMAAALGLAAAYVIVLAVKKKLTAGNAVKAVIFAGMVMRIGYMFYTPCNVRSHDMYGIELNSIGHGSYILNLLQNGSLPQSNEGQFYQQPFFYLVGSVFSKLITSVTGAADAFSLVDAAKTVSCAASCIMLIATDAICDEFKLGSSEKLLAMLTAAFHPCFLLGIRVTPDMLCALFMTLALLFTFKWYGSPNWKNTVILALIYGFGVMTKISVAVSALFTAAVFAVKLVQLYKEKKALQTVLKLSAFGLISLPLGLWYSVRNYIRFGQKLSYVMEVIEKEQSPIYIGDRSIFERFVIPDFGSLFRSPYIEIADEYNYFVYSVKTSMFGEFKYNVPSIFPMMLYISAVILAAAAIAAAVSAVRKPKRG